MRPSRALLAGLLHGPAELLPVSSSAHTALAIGTSGRADVRKAFEVALHAGSLPGLLRVAPRPRPAFAVLTVVPPAVAGLALEGPIERRLGTPRGIAAGLVAGSAILTLVERRASRRPDLEVDSRWQDALTIGAAQALALVPGLSRTGMTYAAARARGFGPEASLRLSREAAVPVLAAATALKAVRLAQDGLPRDARGAFVLGTAAAAVSGWVAAPALRDRIPVATCSLERIVVAALTTRVGSA